MFNCVKIVKKSEPFMKNLSQSRILGPIIKVIKNKYLIVTLLFVVWILFLDTNNLFVWYKDLKQISVQNRQKQHYKEAIKRAEENLNELTSNQDSLETFARENYLFHKEGEDVYVVEPAK